ADQIISCCQWLKRVTAIRGCASAGTALAYSRFIPPLDRLMLADYDASIRTAETRKQEETLMPYYEKGNVRIYYEEAGSGFPLLVIPGGGLNSTVAGLKTHPFNPFDQF